METGEAILPLAAKARQSGYMGNIRSRVRVGVKEIPLLRPKVIHDGPWIPVVGPVAVPVKEASRLQQDCGSYQRHGRHDRCYHRRRRYEHPGLGPG